MLTLVQSQMYKLWKDEDGIGVIEIVVIVAILLILALTFRTEITKMLSDIIKKANEQKDKVLP
ncbi:Flp1 family type IVb pilin [Paenibacillus marinisediminis]